MNLIKLEAVRRHTRRELTPDQAKTLVSHPNISVVKAQGGSPVVASLGQHARGMAAARSLPRPDRGDAVADELNLDVDAADKVAAILTAAANAYQASALELTAAWQDHRVPMIWAAIAGELAMAEAVAAEAQAA